MRIIDGWLLDARRVESPNCDIRPEGTCVSLLVVHGISLPPGELGGPWIDALFTNALNPEAHPYFRDIAGLRVSSHLLIRRDGDLVQYVPSACAHGMPGFRASREGRAAMTTR